MSYFAQGRLSELRGEVKELRKVLSDFAKGSFTATTTLSFLTASILAAVSPALPLVATLPLAAPIVLSEKPVTAPTPLRQLIQQEAHVVPLYKLSREVYTISDLWRM